MTALKGQTVTTHLNRQLVFEELKTKYQFHLARSLGHGGFGEVYEAQTTNGVRCALKISLDAIDHSDGMAAKELEALATIKQLPANKYIVTLIDYWVIHGYLVTRWELGQQSLADLQKEYRRDKKLPGIPRPTLWRYVAQAAFALDFLYDRGFCHRDVKPENLILFAGDVKLADLGLVKFKGASTGVHTRGAGTLGYMSPEADTGRLFRTSDLYGLAGSYIYLRTGRADHCNFARDR